MTCSKKIRPARGVQHLGQGELGLHHRQPIQVSGVTVCLGEQVRQDRQPFVQQRLNRRWSEPVADGLQRDGVIDLCERVVHPGEPEPRLRCLPLRPVMGVDAELAGVREIRRELQEERPEIGGNAVEVEL